VLLDRFARPRKVASVTRPSQETSAGAAVDPAAGGIFFLVDGTFETPGLSLGLAEL
jgi:hypothetical protein